VIHEIHEVGWGIGQAEGNYGVFKQTDIGCTDFQLMISSAEINLGEHVGSI
jgi:hypothetical protein